MNKLDFVDCSFTFQNTNIVKCYLNVVNCNGEPFNCMEKYNNSFIIRFDKDLNLKNVKYVDFDEDNMAIIINNSIYYILESDLSYFVSDFHANFQEALGNLVQYIAKALIDDYM